MLDSLGFLDRHKAAQGKYLLLIQETRRQIHDLWRRYGSQYVDESQFPLSVQMAQCPHCQQQGATTSTAGDAKPSAPKPAG
jgi:hypothetical protein